MRRPCLREEQLTTLLEFAVRGLDRDAADSHIRQSVARYPGRSVVALRWFRVSSGFAFASVGGVHVPNTVSVTDYESLERSCPTCKGYSYATGYEVHIRWPGHVKREELHAVKAENVIRPGLPEAL